MKDVKMGSGVGWGERARSERERGREREKLMRAFWSGIGVQAKTDRNEDV